MPYKGTSLASNKHLKHMYVLDCYLLLTTHYTVQ